MVEKRKSYHKVLEEIEDLCKKNPFSNHIISVYVAGSVARGDFVPGRSDIDIYAVVQERDEDVEGLFEEELERLEDEYLEEIKKIEPLEVTFTDIEEVKKGDSFLGTGFEYHNFMNSAYVLYGEDIRDEIPQPTKDEERESAQRFLDAMEERSEYIPKRFTRKLFSSVFRTLSVFLCGRGIYVSSKEKVVEEFQRISDLKELNESLEEVYALWETWAERDLTEDEFCGLYKNYQEIMSSLSELREMEVDE
ncbi:MAG: nucleotidyltransferase domain-containing protein [Thermoplasmata archaeon]